MRTLDSGKWVLKQFFLKPLRNWQKAKQNGRCGEIIDVRRYGGRWDVACDADVVESCVKDFEGAPKAYALDFGVTKDGETILVEVNNTCSIGSYGLEPVLYARFLSARWAELTGTTDECF